MEKIWKKMEKIWKKMGNELLPTKEKRVNVLCTNLIGIFARQYRYATTNILDGQGVIKQ